MSSSEMQTSTIPMVPGLDAYADQRMLLSDCDAKSIVDVGANVGDTVEKYYYLFPNATVHAFEPDPETFSTLKQRFEPHPRVRCWCSAVSSQSSREPFFVNQDAGTNSLLPRPSEGRRYYNKLGVLRKEIEVPTTTLDEFCHDQGITSLDILKLDIQGGELLAMQGAAGLLAAQAVKVVYSEVQFTPLYEQAPLFHDVCAFLESKGYSLFGLYDLVAASNGQLRFADAIFIPQSVRDGVLDRFPEEPY